MNVCLVGADASASDLCRQIDAVSNATTVVLRHAIAAAVTAAHLILGAIRKEGLHERSCRSRRSSADAAGIRVVSGRVTTDPRPWLPSGWRLTFEDDFDGDQLDPTRWRTDRDGWRMNGVTVDPSNVRVADGALQLTLASATSGASVQSTYGLPIGGVAEARIRFPGDGRRLYNWPAFWLHDWGGQARRGGENDVAEVLGGQIASAYHSPDVDDNHGPHVDRYLGDEWHTWTLHRQVNRADVYLDGDLVKTWPTSDNGTPQPIILTVGAGPDPSRAVYGPPSRLFVDHIRAWELKDHPGPIH